MKKTNISLFSEHGVDVYIIINISSSSCSRYLS